MMLLFLLENPHSSTLNVYYVMWARFIEINDHLCKADGQDEQPNKGPVTGDQCFCMCLV